MREKSLCYWLRMAAVAVTLIGLILFIVAKHQSLGQDGAEAYVAIIILVAAGIVLQIVSLVGKYWFLKYFSLSLYIGVGILFLNKEMPLIVTVLAGYDTTQVNIVWKGSIVCWLLTMILTVATMVMYERKRSIRLQ